MTYVSFAGFFLTLLAIGTALFKLFKAGARGVISINKLIESVEANTLAQTQIVKAQSRTGRTVERFRKTTKTEIASVKMQIEELDHRLDDFELILSSPRAIKKVG